MIKVIWLAGILFSANLVASDHVMYWDSDASSDIRKIKVEAAIGEVRVIPSLDRQVHVELDLDKINGFTFLWENKAKGQAGIEAKSDGDTLHLKRSGKGKFAESWTIRVPDIEKLNIDMGVGEVTVRDISASIDVDLGVGDIVVETRQRFISKADLDVGIGDAVIRDPENRHKRSGWLGGEVLGDGPGGQNIRIDLGIGDAVLSLKESF